jgi:uncharacterized lipoprotein YbaY
VVELVTGALLIRANTPAFANGTAHISLEDITYADAPSQTVASVTITGVSHAHEGKETRVPFSLDVPTADTGIDPGADYAVQAWIDRLSDGHMRKGDLISDQVYRVLTGGFGSDVTVVLRPIE